MSFVSFNRSVSRMFCIGISNLRRRERENVKWKNLHQSHCKLGKSKNDVTLQSQTKIEFGTFSKVSSH